MNESISRAAGAQHGQEMPPERMEALIRSAGRDAAAADDALRRAARGARAARRSARAPLAEPVNPPVQRGGPRGAAAARPAGAAPPRARSLDARPLELLRTPARRRSRGCASRARAAARRATNAGMPRDRRSTCALRPSRRARARGTRSPRRATSSTSRARRARPRRASVRRSTPWSPRSSALGPERVHQPVVDGLVQAAVARELGHAQRVARVRDRRSGRARKLPGALEQPALDARRRPSP